MADIVVSGNSSGSVTLRAPDVSGTTILTLPTTSGTLVTTAGGSTVPFALGSAAAPSITFTGDTNTGIYSPAADTIAFTEGGVESMRIDASGNVGIGTSSPSTPLSGARGLVLNSGATNDNQIRLQNDKTGSTASDGFLLSIDGSTPPNAYVYNYENSPIVFGTNNAERMRIDDTGRVFVGTSSIFGLGAFILPKGGVDPQFALTGSASSTELGFNMYSTAPNNYRFYVRWDGTIFAINTTISAISDQRLKENVVDLDVGLNAVMALKPRKFDWKEGKGKNIKGDRGFIAQEFEQVFPDLIDDWKDPAPEGEQPYKSVRADLIPILVKAVQELNAKVTALEAQLGAK